MAGTVDIVQRGYTGLEARDDILWFNPALPQNLECLFVRLRYRQHFLEVSLYRDRIRITTHRDAPEAITIGVQGQVRQLEPGGVLELKLQG
jgi:trehalose/maltose hydrolase-like predicted phosphorylase